MKKNSIFLLGIILVLSLLFSGCRKVIDPGELPEQDARIVLNCILENSQAIHANVTASKSIVSGKDYKLLDNAICDLYEDGKFVERLVNAKNGDFDAKLKPFPNKTYTLRVSNSGYKNIEGSTKMPDSLWLAKVERYDTINSVYRKDYQKDYNHLGGTMKFRILLNDDNKTKNYITFFPIIVLYDSLMAPITQSVSPYVTLINNASNSQQYGTSINIDDQNLINGKQILLDIEIGFNEYNLPSIPAYYVEVYGLLGNLSEDLYKYKVTLNQQASVSGGLFAEPVLVYNNISNGMGIIGGQNSKMYKIYGGVIKK